MLKLSAWMQWRNRWRQCPPTFFTGKFYDLPGKKGQGRKGNGEEKKENLKGKWKIENGRGKVWKWAEDFFFICFCFLFVWFFFLLVTFWNHWNLFGVYQNGQFSWEKSYFMLGKNQETWLCPLWKIFLLATPLHKWKHRLWEPIDVLQNLFLFFLYMMVPKSIELLFLSR